MTLRFVLDIRRTNDELLANFMGEIHRLCKEKRDFIIGFKGGRKLYLETCKGLRKDAYICINDKSSIAPVIATINYAFALGCNCSVSLAYEHFIFFDFSAYDCDKIMKINIFAESLEVDVETL